LPGDPKNAIGVVRDFDPNMDTVPSHASSIVVSKSADNEESGLVYWVDLYIDCSFFLLQCKINGENPNPEVEF